MTNQGNSSHVASALSIADILAVLYGSILNVDAINPKINTRDRLILSKGHAGAAVYAVLAEMGFIDVETLKSHYQNGSILSGHVSHKDVAGVEISTGSLGHGLSIGAGMAYNGKLENQSHRIFVILGDGECDEGSVWEAAMFSAHHKLSNLIAIVDYNKIQSMDAVEKTLNLEPFADKWRSFGWNTFEIDGHDHDKILSVCADASLLKEKPICIIAHTVKGKGISFMENEVLWHYRSPQGDDFINAMRELEIKS
jgi:transketolase